MYKLVVVAGKKRGEEFVLKNGDNVLGRSDEVDIPFQVQGVSKNHMCITVTDDAAYIKDLGSSNGTFLNGKVITRATAKHGDKIALPDAILQVVYVKEKKRIIKKKIERDSAEDVEEEFLTGGEPPSDHIGRIIHLFKYRLMNLFYGINQEYEWRVLFGIVLTVALVLTITITIFPVLNDSHNSLIRETRKRGALLADVVARQNEIILQKRQYNQVRTGFIDDRLTDGGSGIVGYELFDLEGRIIAPIEKKNEYISDPFSVQAREWAMKSPASNLERPFFKSLESSQIGIARKIMAYNQVEDQKQGVGVIAIKFRPQSVVISANSGTKKYLIALVYAFIVGVFFYGIVYFLNLRPIEELKFELEEAIRGRKRNVEGSYMMSELHGIKNSINSTLQRLRELQDTDSDEFAELESDEGYVNSLIEVLQGFPGPGLVLNSEKNLMRINPIAEDITGIRESSSQGMSLLDVSREKGFAATVIELCDESANNGGVLQQGDYELSGTPYNVNVVSLIGKDNFAKAFLVSFVEES